MNKKTLHTALLGIFLFLLCGTGIILFLYHTSKLSLEEQQKNEQQKYNVSASLQQNDPLFQKTFIDLLQKKPEADEDLAQLRSTYATGTSERNTIELSVASIGVFSTSTEGSVADLKRILLDDKAYNKTARAFSIEFMARAYWAVNDPTILRNIFSGDPFFTTILSQAGGDMNGALTKLLIYGYGLSPTPITIARLAETASNVLVSDKTTTIQKQTASQYFDQLIKAGAIEVQKMTGPAYAQYRSEFYSIYGGALATAVIGHISPAYTTADVERAYDQSYSEALDNFKPYVIYRYGTFLSQVTSVDTAKIENLSKELAALTPGQTQLFDSFLRAILNQGADDKRYTATHAYMDASPTFKVYVSERVLK